MILLIRRLSAVDLIEMCRSMRYALASGLLLRDVMELLSQRGTARVRNVATRIAQELKAGWSLPEALEKQQGLLPPLFISLATVGEESGNLPEVLAEMEKYYSLRLKLWRDFIEQVSWPVLQFVAAVIVISLLIYILGIIPKPDIYAAPIDPLGLGLTGPRGAVIFAGSVVGILLGATLLYLILARLLRRRAMLERALLYVPGVGPCIRAMALTRFCVAGRLMMETSLSILKTIRLAFLATDNTAFITAFPEVEKSLKQGNSISSSFTKAGVFPARFLSAVGVAEESGRLPETLRHQAEEYDDEARRRLNWLTKAGSWLVWLAVVIIIIVCIFRVFNEVYLKNINRFLDQPGNSQKYKVNEPQAPKPQKPSGTRPGGEP
jgi:type IV pilus assembly protein PilC